jgi:hypothetical protein
MTVMIVAVVSVVFSDVTGDSVDSDVVGRSGEVIATVISPSTLLSVITVTPATVTAVLFSELWPSRN